MIKRIKNNQFAKNSLILFAGTMIGNFIGYVFHFVIGRMVSVPVYGEVESLISFIAIISVPASTVAMVATKFGAQSKAENDFGGSHVLFSYLNSKIFKYGLPLLILTVCLTPVFRDYFKLESIWPIMIVWGMMFLSFFSAVTTGILNGWQKFRDSSIAGVSGAVVKLASAVAMVKIGYAAGGVVGGYALGGLATYFITVYFLRFILSRKGKLENIEAKINLKEVKKYVVPVFVGNLAVAILSNADMVLAKHNLSEVAAGQYGALTIVSKIIFFATGIIATVLFSMSSEEHHKNSGGTKTFRQSLYLMAFLGLGALIFYYFFPKFIMGLIFGDKYGDMSGMLIWFAVSVTLFSFLNLFFQYLLSIHRTEISYYLLAISVLAVIIIELSAKSIFGIIGITATAQLLGAASGAYLLLKKPKKSI